MAPVSRRSERSLQLDYVVGSQPELGPAAPDGGFGWVVLLGVVMLRISIPALLISYGVFILKANEFHQPVQSLLMKGQTSWNGVSVWVPVFFSAAWSFTDPWSRTLAAVSSVRCTAVVGVFMVSAGLAAASFAVTLGDPIRFYISCLTAGLIAGMGASLATTPADFLLTRYFRTRLAAVQSLARAAQAVGYCTMPLIVCTLLAHYGFRSTVLIQSVLVLQGLMGVAFFRSPVYVQPPREMAYTLLQNDEENVSTEKVEADTQPSSSQKYEDVPDGQQPFYDSMPRPLFSDVELAASGHDVAFFIEDPTDEDMVLYVYGDHLRRNFNYTEELKMLFRPIFHGAILLLVVTRVTNVAFWLLLPSLATTRIIDLGVDQATGLVSAAGLIDVCMAASWHWITTISPLAKKRLISTSCFLAAGGLYALSYGKTLLWLISATVVLRLGTSCVDTTGKLMLQEVLGQVEFRRAHSLLDVLTGLLLLLSTLGLGEDYSLAFWFLSWFQILAGIVWGLQPFVGMCCSKWSRH